MTIPNTKFDLTVRDIEMIENALRDRQRTIIEYKLTDLSIKNVKLADKELAELIDLLARLYDQKIFYRPKGIYVGG
jgi:hypothetical protein